MLVGLVAMLFAACSEDLYTDDGDFVGEKGYITLRFVIPQAAVEETRATTADGDDLLNENVINFVDLYFYPTGKSKENAVIVEKNHSVIRDTSGGDATYLVKVRTGDIRLNSLFGSTQNGSCEVYAIANSSAESPSESTALNVVRQRVLRHNFGAQLVQSYFIMQSNPEKLATVTLKDGAATGTIPMTRVAAKLQLYLNVPDTLHVNSEDGSGFAVWKADREHMSIEFDNGLMDYTLDGSDTAHPDSSFYNSMQLDMSKYTSITKNTVSYDYSHTPVYSYPYTWQQMDAHLPTFIIAVPWSKLNPGNNTYGPPQITYYQLHPNLRRGELSSGDLSSRELQSNYFYRMYMKIETVGSTDNTTPIDITPSGYRIQPWGEVKLNTPKDVTGEFYRYTYLVVDPTSVVLNNTSTTTLRYSSSSALTKDTKITKVEYNSYETPGQVTHHTLEANEIAALTTNRYELDYTSTPGQIKFTHNVDDGTYAAKTITIQVANDDGLMEFVTITQYPAIYMHTFVGDNAFVDGYFSHVQAPAMNNATSNSSVDDDYTGYRSVNYGTTTIYYNRFRTIGDYHYDGVASGFTVPYGSMVLDLTSTAQDAQGNRITQKSITEITVTSFNRNNAHYSVGGSTLYYKIGDPRVAAGYSSNDLEPYLTTQTRQGSGYYYYYYRSYNTNYYDITTTPWTKASSIKKASESDAAQTIIAPQFFISSGWNSSTSVSFENAQKRAATYQEAGYSAGRWRLPTEAEIMFITARQREGVIPTLFGSNAPYWAASGRVYFDGAFYDADHVRSTNGSSYAYGGYVYASGLSGNGTAYMRFAYDTWYWGDKPGDVNSYHPEP